MKKTLVLVLIIVFTIGLGAAGIYIAIRMQDRVGSEKSEAAVGDQFTITGDLKCEGVGDAEDTHNHSGGTVSLSEGGSGSVTVYEANGNYSLNGTQVDDMPMYIGLSSSSYTTTGGTNDLNCIPAPEGSENEGKWECLTAPENGETYSGLDFMIPQGTSAWDQYCTGGGGGEVTFTVTGDLKCEGVSGAEDLFHEGNTIQTIGSGGQYGSGSSSANGEYSYTATVNPDLGSDWYTSVLYPDGVYTPSDTVPSGYGCEVAQGDEAFYCSQLPEDGETVSGFDFVIASGTSAWDQYCSDGGGGGGDTDQIRVITRCQDGTGSDADLAGDANVLLLHLDSETSNNEHSDGDGNWDGDWIVTPSSDPANFNDVVELLSGHSQFSVRAQESYNDGREFFTVAHDDCTLDYHNYEYCNFPAALYQSDGTTLDPFVFEIDCGGGGGGGDLGCWESCDTADDQCETGLTCQDDGSGNDVCRTGCGTDEDHTTCTCEEALGGCGDACTDNDDCESGLTCQNSICWGDSCATDNGNPACTSATATNNRTESTGLADVYPGDTLMVQVTGDAGEWNGGTPNVAWMQYATPSGSWPSAAGPLDRGEYNYQDAVNGLNWTAPETPGLYKVDTGVGYISSPGDGDNSNDEGEICRGVPGQWQIMTPTGSSYDPCGDPTQSPDCACENDSCMFNVDVIDPPSCDGLSIYNSAGQDVTDNPTAHPGETLTLKAEGDVGDKAWDDTTYPVYIFGYASPEGGGSFEESPAYPPYYFVNAQTTGSDEGKGIYDVRFDSTFIPIFDDDTTEAMNVMASTANADYIMCVYNESLVDLSRNNHVIGSDLCTATNCEKTVRIVRVPSLDLDKSVSTINAAAPTTDCSGDSGYCESDNLAAGDVVTYTLQVENNGDIPLESVVVDDRIRFDGALAAGANATITNASNLRKCADANCTSFEAGSTRTATINANTDTVTWQQIASLDDGDVWQATVEVTLAGAFGTPNHVLENHMRVQDDVICQGNDGCQDLVWHAIGAPVNLELTKGADVVPPNELVPGDDVTFTVNVTNPSAADVANVEVTATLPTDYEDYFDWPPNPIAVDQGTYTTVRSSGTIVWTVGTLAAGDSADLEYTTTVSSDLSLTSDCSAYLQDSASITGAGGAAILPSDATETVFVLDPICGVSTGWTVEKTATPANVAPGGTVTFVIDITNNGDIADYVTEVTDTLPSGFSYAGTCTATKPDSTTFDCEPTTTGQTLTWTFPSTGNTSVNVANGENMLITFTATASSSPGSYSNVACLEEPANGCGDATVYVGGTEGQYMEGTQPQTISSKGRMVQVVVATAAILGLGALIYWNRTAQQLVFKFINGVGSKLSRSGKVIKLGAEQRRIGKFEKNVEEAIEVDLWDQKID